MESRKNGQFSLLTGMDAYGRVVSPCGSARAGKKVGMFFWLWIGQPYASGAYDAGKILDSPDGFNKLFFQDSPESPDRQQHFWGQPIWGYYNSEDEWVIRRQLELLMLAGVDFIVFDATNAQTYKNVYTRILSQIEQMQANGWQPPKAAFYTHSYSMRTVATLYEELYRPGLYPNSWYKEGGKPVIIAYTDPADDRRWAFQEMKDDAYHPLPYPKGIQDFFRFYKPQWPLDPFYSDGFPWVEWTFPQPLHTDVMSVSVASHPNVPFSFTLTRGVENWGRGWDVHSKENRAELVDIGGFFQSQWDHAITQDPGTVFVGGWNEWIAYKQPWEGEYMMCDAVNREFSRDIEPMQGGHEDAFYLQLINGIRRYKYNPVDAENVGRAITYYAGFPDAPGRDAPGVCKDLRYVQPTLPNHIQCVTVSADSDKLEFDVTLRQPVIREDFASFRLLLGGGYVHKSGFECYDWVVTSGTEHHGLLLHKAENENGDAQPVEHSIDGNHLVVRLDRKLFPASENQIYFKAAIQMEQPRNIMSYYTSGSTLPPGRLSYVYPLIPCN